MVRYISLLKFTHQGAEKMEESPHRANLFQEEAAAAGIRVESVYWCSGGVYDALLILSADDEHAALHQLARLKKTGNVIPENMRLFAADEFDILIGLKNEK